MGTVQIKKIRAPKGFIFKITKNFVNSGSRGINYNASHLLKKEKKKLQDVIIELHRKVKNSTEYVGRICLCKFDSKSFETHSSLNSNYHGKGYGAKMYARAIQWCLENGYRVRSSGRSSDMALRVWKGKTLRRYFNVKRSSDGLTFYSWAKSV